MFRTVPPVIRGCNATGLQAIVNEYGDPHHDDAEVTAANEGETQYLPNNEPLWQGLIVSARANHDPITPQDQVGPEIEDALPDMPSELLDLMGLRGRYVDEAPSDDCLIPVDEDLVTAIADANG